MTRIILIETSTALCSAALSEDGRVVRYVESSEPRAHASMAAPFVKEVLGDLRVSDCDAVCVSSGPGSYTGLRVGVSTAKGLCFGAGIPLISVGTLEALVFQAISEGLVPEGCPFIVPSLDARRMEVYSAVYTGDGKLVREVRPEVITAESFEPERAEGPVLFIGDAADKCRPILGDGTFVQCCPKASSLAVPAFKAYKEKRFEDTAYFEPFYLKEFTATVSRKNLF